MKYPVVLLSVAFYDEADYQKRTGVRVRVYRTKVLGGRPVSRTRDYYPSAGLQKFITRLAWTHEINTYGFWNRRRLFIRPHRGA